MWNSALGSRTSEIIPFLPAALPYTLAFLKMRSEKSKQHNTISFLSQKGHIYEKSKLSVLNEDIDLK